MEMGKLNGPKILFSIFLMAMAALWVYPGISEGACGAAASSCKNCHEIKGEKKVNTSGAWHTQHAFGDFCVFCHSGNTAAAAKAEAHKGMVKPLANLEQSCAACHPDDFEKRSTGYGAVIKPKAGPGAGSSGPDKSLAAGQGTGTEGIAADQAKGSEKQAYAIPHPTPDPASVSKEDLINYNLLLTAGRKGMGLSITLGDWILITLTLVTAMGFPFLHWLFRPEGPSPSRDGRLRKRFSMHKGAMDKGMA